MPFKLMLFFLFYRRFYLQTFMFVVTELLHNISHYKVQIVLHNNLLMFTAMDYD